MNLLAVDSACSILSVALSCNDKIFYEQLQAGTKQSECVMDIIDSLVKEASLKPEDLNGILCMGGPGSFTGLRIGYSIAKGLALSLSIPVVPVPTLDCVAFEARNEGLVLAVIQARKNAWFYSFFKNGDRITCDSDGEFEQIAAEIERHHEKIILTGPGSKTFHDLSAENIKEKIILKNQEKGYARELISIAKMQNLLDNDNTAYLYSGPEYIRKTDAELRNPV